tara:strand:+ start:732 stop:1604 length:873 start_codon:yes stop_codon:yes gene_type:complete
MEIKDVNTIFILGIARSGSKFYTQLLNSHQNICIAPELNYHFPIKKDLRDIVVAHKSKGLLYIIDQIFKSELKNTITDVLNVIKKKKMEDEVRNIKNFNSYFLLKIILKLFSYEKGKKIYGAKYPVHFSNFDLLENNFFNAKFIFIIRNPFEIARSDIIKKARRIKKKKSTFIINNLFIFYLVYPFYLSFEWFRLVRTFEVKLKKLGHEKILLCRYEEIKNNSYDLLNKIAVFINQDSKSFDLNKVKQVDSSRNHNNFISPIVYKYMNFVISVLIKNKLKQYNYINSKVK